jgi:predicted DCC family thiol-disulfide oxidoreductase YuxK
MCRRAKGYLEARIPAHRLRYLPCQDEERGTVAPSVSETDCMQAMQLVLSDGSVHPGPDAFPYLAAMMRGFRLLAPLLRVPGVVPLLRPVYATVARNRMALSGLFREKEGASCSIDKGCR